MPGPDLPPPAAPMTAEALLARWPTAAPKAELVHGVLVFAGDFDERDVEAARRTYPGRRPVLNADGGLEVHPAGTGVPTPLVSRTAGPSGQEGGT
ncbi:hypothetical protein [Streptomyces sp. A0592]|uniref:hypothetical protein n=1 Tax=Streptomyces sp. A0592 TaxID=2563099 RepID=UPI00109E6658|nr:hypothetical protein [Streptomyces sp. A0592]THA80262.1 hypothetical protein E6U81_29135 [Streptomyces sp. A0592]